MRKWVTAVGMFLLAGLLLTGCQSANALESLPELVIGYDNYEPYSYVDENGEMAGIDVELALEACRRMGRKPVFVFIKWDDKKDILERGEIDCIWSCFTISGREDQYMWSIPYMNSRQVVVVPEESPIRTLADLNGKKMGVQSSTKPEELLLKREEPGIPVVSDVYCMEQMELVFACLQKGYVDAVSGHETAVRKHMEATPGSYRILDESLMDVVVGVAFDRSGDPAMVRALNDALESMAEDGTSAAILGKYGVEIKGGDSAS